MKSQLEDWNVTKIKGSWYKKLDNFKRLNYPIHKFYTDAEWVQDSKELFRKSGQYSGTVYPRCKAERKLHIHWDEEFWEGQPVGVRFALQVRTQVSGNLYDEQSGGINGEFSDSFRRVTQYNTAWNSRVLLCTALRGDLAGFRSQADAENCILTCGKAHYAYCLMEMAENRHNLREQCRCMFFAERTSLRDW